MARKLCIDCKTRTAQSDTPEGQLCHPCESYAGSENQHDDRGHDNDNDATDEKDNCPVCHPELDPREFTMLTRKGHANGGRTGTYMSHKGHNHPSTPKARETCRREIAKAAEPTE